MANTPDSVDVYVGNTIRARRRLAGVSQERLAEACGVTFQQVQKYERGANRVSCSMLSRIAQHLNAPPGSFFPPLDDEGLVAGLGPVDELAAAAGGYRLARFYLALPPEVRPSLVRVAEAMSDALAEEPGSSYVSGADPALERHVA